MREPNKDKYRPSFEEAREAVFHYLNVNDKPQQADAIYVLGGASFDSNGKPSLKRVEKAAELYDKGPVK